MRTMNVAYTRTTTSLMNVADQLEKIALSWEVDDPELKEQLDEIWDDIYDIIIYRTIPRSLGTEYNKLMKAIYDE